MIVSPCGLFEGVDGPYPGRDHDSNIVARSDLEERLSTFAHYPVADGNGRGVDYQIYGDPAYARSRFIRKPFNRLRGTALERQYNSTMSSGRVSVENAIGTVVGIFPALDFLRLERSLAGGASVCTRYLVAVIFRNMFTCIRGHNQISKFFECEPPSLDEFLAEREMPPPRLVDLGIIPEDAY